MIIQTIDASRLASSFAPPPDAAGGDGNPKLEVYVIFTDERGTLAALEAAGKLAQNLEARINLIAAQVVPLAFPISRPPVSLSFTLRRLQDLACQGAQGDLETGIQLYLCRDKRQTVLKVLRPGALVVVGGKKTWWPSKAARIAKMLEQHGYRVIFAALQRRGECHA
ncbi:MAG TPA: hypothetical protein VGV68_11610 [Terriglobia bacterium]|nr:hypothetical protein [Terriglobia bacterium]